VLDDQVRPADREAAEASAACAVAPLALRRDGLLDWRTADVSVASGRRRERQQQRFKSQASAPRFLTTHAAIYNTFNIQRHSISRPALRRFRADADGAWAAAVA